MVSVASLLNPDPPRAPMPSTLQTPDSSVRLTLSSPTEEAAQTSKSVDAAEMTRDSQLPGRSRSKGVVNFPPFEDVDDAAMHEIRRFQIQNFGSIRGTCRRIPYNSGKKDFSQKTGRESFEVFQYEFRLPGEDSIYTIMWDYHIGLVRMTPFFKCCKYSKTTPAKMLGLNPGLRDITHSITGGSIKAQGYWMPYRCAKAVCATFCHHIAGALIPLFGPDFPSQCIPRENPRFGHMVIDPAITEVSTREARKFLHLNSPYGTPLTPPRTESISPRSGQPFLYPVGHRIYNPEDGRCFPYTNGLSPVMYQGGSGMEIDRHPGTKPSLQYIYQNPTSTYRGGADAAQAIPRSADVHSSSWTAVNRQAPYYHTQQTHEYCGSNLAGGVGSLQEGPSPYLSAVPTRRGNRQHPYSRYHAPTSFAPPDHRLNEPSSGGYEPRRSPATSTSATILGDSEPDSGCALPSPVARHVAEDSRTAAEKDAALMLMTLRVPGSSQGAGSPPRDASSLDQRTVGRNYTPSSGSECTAMAISKPPSPSPMASRITAPFARGEPRTKKRRATLT